MAFRELLLSNCFLLTSNFDGDAWRSSHLPCSPAASDQSEVFSWCENSVTVVMLSVLRSSITISGVKALSSRRITISLSLSSPLHTSSSAVYLNSSLEILWHLVSVCPISMVVLPNDRQGFDRDRNEAFSPIERSLSRFVDPNGMSLRWRHRARTAMATGSLSSIVLTVRAWSLTSSSVSG